MPETYEQVETILPQEPAQQQAAPHNTQLHENNYSDIPDEYRLMSITPDTANPANELAYQLGGNSERQPYAHPERNPFVSRMRGENRRENQPRGQRQPEEQQQEIQIPEPSLHEKTKPEFWRGIYTRLDQEKIITDFLNDATVVAHASPEEGIETQKWFGGLLNFTAAAKTMSGYSKADLENPAYAKAYVDVTQQGYSIQELERRGYILPHGDPKTIKPDAYTYNREKANGEFGARLVNELNQLADLNSRYSEIKAMVWKEPIMPSQMPKYLDKLVEFIIDKGMLNEMDITMIRKLEGLMPSLRRDLERRDAIPNIPDMKKEAAETHKYAKEMERPEKPSYKVVTEKIDDPLKSPVMDYKNVPKILMRTVPLYFLENHLNSVSFSTKVPEVKDSDGTKRQVGSQIYTTTDIKGRPSTYDIKISGDWWTEPGKHDRSALSQSVVERLLYQTSHIIVEQLPTEDLIRWFEIYEIEVGLDLPNQKIVEKAIQEKKCPQVELFAALYSRYILDPNYFERTNVLAAGFMSKIISQFSSEEQKRLIEDTRYRRRAR